MSSGTLHRGGQDLAGGKGVLCFCEKIHSDIKKIHPSKDILHYIINKDVIISICMLYNSSYPRTDGVTQGGEFVDHCSDKRQSIAYI